MTEANDMTTTTGILVLRYVRTRAAMRELGPLTTKNYRRVLIGFAQTAGVDRNVRKIQRRHIEAWLTKRDQDGITPATLGNNFSMVRGFFEWARDNGYITKSPCDGIRGPRRPTSTPRDLEPDEVSAILAACADARERLIVTLMVQGGLRSCEVSRLETGKIDLAERVMLVHGKGDKERWLPITDETLRAIHEYAAEAPMIAGPLIRSYREPSRHVSADRLGAIVRRIMLEAGVKQRPRDGRSAHALRHTCASDLLDAGADIEDVRQALGHQSLQTTSRYTKRRHALTRLATAMEGRVYRGIRPVERGVA